MGNSILFDKSQQHLLADKSPPLGTQNPGRERRLVLEPARLILVLPLRLTLRHLQAQPAHLDRFPFGELARELVENGTNRPDRFRFAETESAHRFNELRVPVALLFRFRCLPVHVSRWRRLLLLFWS